MLKYVGPFVLVICYLIYSHKDNSALHYDPGVLIAAEPLQRAITHPEKFIYHDYLMKSLADFEVDARVLSRTNYYSGYISEISTTDLALGWGEMSDQGVLDQLEIWQSNRWYFWEEKEIASIPSDRIIQQSTNIHIIAMNPEIREEIANIKNGSLVRLKGKLVTISKRGVEIARSSLSRKDTGIQACEVLLVQEFSQL